MSKENKKQGKDYYAELVDDSPIQREIKVNGRVQTVWFKRCTAAQRIKLNSGVRFKTTGPGKTESTVDMAEYLKRQHLLVAYSNVREDGTRIFMTAEQVGELDGAILDALLKHATELNDEDSNEGKDSKLTPNSAST